MSRFRDSLTFAIVVFDVLVKSVLSTALSSPVDLLSSKLIRALFAQNRFNTSLRKPSKAPCTLLTSIVHRRLSLFWHHQRHLLNLELLYLHFIVFNLAQKLNILPFKLLTTLLTFSNSAPLFFNDFLITVGLLLK